MLLEILEEFTENDRSPFGLIKQANKKELVSKLLDLMDANLCYQLEVEAQRKESFDSIQDKSNAIEMKQARLYNYMNSKDNDDEHDNPYTSQINKINKQFQNASRL